VDKGTFIRQVKDSLAGESLAARVDQAGPSPVPGDGDSQEEYVTRYRVVASKLNIRSGPGTEYSDLGDLFAGEMITPVDITGWLLVQSDNNKIGWLARQYLEPVNGAPEPKQAIPDETSSEPGKMKTSPAGLEFIGPPPAA
jgi:uncharacterized protein YgiM (DUF1202 family)